MLSSVAPWHESCVARLGLTCEWLRLCLQLRYHGWNQARGTAVAVVSDVVSWRRSWRHALIEQGRGSLREGTMKVRSYCAEGVVYPWNSPFFQVFGLCSVWLAKDNACLAPLPCQCGHYFINHKITVALILLSKENIHVLYQTWNGKSRQRQHYLIAGENIEMRLFTIRWTSSLPKGCSLELTTSVGTIMLF